MPVSALKENPPGVESGGFLCLWRLLPPRLFNQRGLAGHNHEFSLCHWEAERAVHLHVEVPCAAVVALCVFGDPDLHFGFLFLRGYLLRPIYISLTICAPVSTYLPTFLKVFFAMI